MKNYTNWEDYEHERNCNAIKGYIFAFLFSTLVWILAFLFVFSCEGETSELSEKEIYQCAMGEARSQLTKYPDEFQAIAEVIRRRAKTTGKQGIYGCFKNFSSENGYIVSMGLDRTAKGLLNASKHSNLSNGATHFESLDFKTPYWAKSMKIVAKHGKTVFYKEGGKQ